MKRTLAALALAALVAAPVATARRRRPTHENPHALVTAVARVETEPRRTRHRNGRSFEELEAVLLSVTPERTPGFAFETRRPVRIVHDLTCGGAWVETHPGDRLDVRGDYVHTPNGRDLSHFTHPADRSCGTGRHAGGYLRPHRDAAGQSPAPEAAPAAAAEATATAPRISEEAAASFRASLRPILSVRCAPCHEPGGKMYARLPFDDPATVASHAARMATRLSGEDRRTLETWAAGADSRPR